MDLSQGSTIAVNIFGAVLSALVVLIAAKYVLLGRIGTADFMKHIEGLYKFVGREDVQTILNNLQEIKKDHIIQYSEATKTIDSKLEPIMENIHIITRMAQTQVFTEVHGRLHHYIEANKKFYDRLNVAKESKEYLGKNICSVGIVQEILEKDDTIFIESGSTLSYFCLQLIGYINDMFHEGRRSRPLRVCTNNVIVYMILLFEENFDPHLLPGNAKNEYAATFGDKSDSCNEKSVYHFLKEHNVRTIFSTSSFLDIEHGPHVGGTTLANWQMKRYLNNYASGLNNAESNGKCKNIFCITAEKINTFPQIDNDKLTNCKLILSDDRNDAPKTCNLLTPDDLRTINANFERYLKTPTNHIIMASSNNQFGKERCHAFFNKHKDYLTFHPIDNQGYLAEFRSK